MSAVPLTDQNPADATSRTARIRHRELLDEHYDQLKGSIVEVVEAGVFRDVDAELAGQFITDAIHVGPERRVSLGHEDAPEEARRAIDEFVVESPYRDD